MRAFFIPSPLLLQALSTACNDFSCILLTSAKAAAALAEALQAEVTRALLAVDASGIPSASPPKPLLLPPIYTVGKATAAALSPVQQLITCPIHIGPGNAEQLLEELNASRELAITADAPALFLHGDKSLDVLPDGLEACGKPCKRMQVYETCSVAATELDEELQRVLMMGGAAQGIAAAGGAAGSATEGLSSSKQQHLAMVFFSPSGVQAVFSGQLMASLLQQSLQVEGLGRPASSSSSSSLAPVAALGCAADCTAQTHASGGQVTAATVAADTGLSSSEAAAAAASEVTASGAAAAKAAAAASETGEEVGVGGPALILIAIGKTTCAALEKAVAAACSSHTAPDAAATSTGLCMSAAAFTASTAADAAGERRADAAGGSAGEGKEDVSEHVASAPSKQCLPSFSRVILATASSPSAEGVKDALGRAEAAAAAAPGEGSSGGSAAGEESSGGPSRQASISKRLLVLV